MQYFRTSLAENIFHHKYAFDEQDNWGALAQRSVNDVVGNFQGRATPLLPPMERARLVDFITRRLFIPGGRYLRYAGRPFHAWNNCFLHRGEYDTREEWGALLQRSSDSLMLGGGIGTDYSIFRERGAKLYRTGGIASGPVPLIHSVNSVGHNAVQGGNRRAAIYASLNWRHPDIEEFLHSKNWHEMVLATIDGRPFTIADAKRQNLDFPAPLDMTNISANYDDLWLVLIRNGELPETYLENVRQARMTGDPGFSFNFGRQSRETLRNACTEVTSEDDSDVCNLGSLNIGAFDNINEFREAVEHSARFLIGGTLRSTLPTKRSYEVRERNRRIGLGLMGLHEWLLKRGYRYEMVPELRKWLEVYRDYSVKAANEMCDELGISRPKGYRAIAPTGTIGILAETTTGIEPIYAVAYKRFYYVDGDTSNRKFKYVVDPVAERLIREHHINPEQIETAANLAADPERRIRFQADIQDYVDMAISSTINLPAWGTDGNNDDHVRPFAQILAKYAPRLRGFTCYPDGARFGQPIQEVPYEEAIHQQGVEFDAVDICDITGKGGSCGV